jgi:hypothetical protein
VNHISKHFAVREPVLTQQLIQAGIAKDLLEIDRITDKLAELGHCRARNDGSMFRVFDKLPRNIHASVGGKNGGAE